MKKHDKKKLRREQIEQKLESSKVMGGNRSRFRFKLFAMKEREIRGEKPSPQKKPKVTLDSTDYFQMEPAAFANNVILGKGNVYVHYEPAPNVVWYNNDND